MPILKPNAEMIERCVQLLRAGECIGMPTETVYGLAADGLNPQAVARIFEIKKRPSFNPLILHVARSYPIDTLAQLNPNAERLIQAFWPGPLTILLPKKKIVPDLVTAGLSTVALRSPSHSVAQELLQRFGGPLAAPSANRFGRISPTDAQAVAEELGAAVSAILDGGSCAIGIESTIADLSSHPPRILRKGAVSSDAIEEALETKCPDMQSGKITAPGMLANHYAPETPLHRATHPLEEASWNDEDAYLFWTTPKRPLPRRARVLTPHGDTAEAAVNLFRMLRELDAMRAKAIWCDPIPITDSLSQAIDDRLKKASFKTCSNTE